MINHALRQAFEEVMTTELHCSYVLYLTLPPNQVDVNVHPAKHEVRFHQARLVHDFIFRALNDGLNQYLQDGRVESEPQILKQTEPKHDYILPLQTQTPPAASSIKEEYITHHAGSAHGHSSGKIARQVITESAKNYQQLMTPSSPSHGVNQSSEKTSIAKPTFSHVEELAATNTTCFGQWLRVNERQMLLTVKSHFYLLDIGVLHKHVLLSKHLEHMPTMQPLLMPVSIIATSELLAQAKQLYQPLLENNVEISWTPNRIILRKVPSEFRQTPWGNILASVLNFREIDTLEVRKHLLSCLASAVKEYTNTQCQDLWQQCLLNSVDAGNTLEKIAKPIPLQEWFNTND